MAGRFLLDTNIVIALFNGDSKIIEQIDKAEEIFLPATVLGELYYGAVNSGRQEENLKRIDTFKPEVSILYTDDTTALIYGRIKKGLKDKGKPIPENDIWIAAIAIQYGLILLSRDTHFDEIEGLIREIV
ncbi:MAG: type II toxin-antitoxin system VapC family toxin [Bacteroidota bacterium]